MNLRCWLFGHRKVWRAAWVASPFCCPGPLIYLEAHCGMCGAWRAGRYGEVMSPRPLGDANFVFVDRESA